jgi:hypothetical protein
VARTLPHTPCSSSSRGDRDAAAGGPRPAGALERVDQAGERERQALVSRERHHHPAAACEPVRSACHVSSLRCVPRQQPALLATPAVCLLATSAACAACLPPAVCLLATSAACLLATSAVCAACHVSSLSAFLAVSTCRSLCLLVCLSGQGHQLRASLRGDALHWLCCIPAYLSACLSASVCVLSRQSVYDGAWCGTS